MVRCSILACDYGCCKIPQRVVLALMLHVMLLNCYNLRGVLNVAIVEMVAPPEVKNTSEVACPEFESHDRHDREGGKFPWPRNTEALVLYAFFIGYTVCQVPGGWLADKFGGRYVIFLGLVISILVTAAFPYCTRRWGHYSAIALRALLGLAQGPMLPVVASFVSTWIPPFERILLGGMVYCGTNLGIISSNVFTGLIIDLTDSWPMAFYIWSGIASGYCVLHLLYVYSFPAHHPNLSPEELEYLNKFLVPKRKLKTPWGKIFTNIPFWANLSGHTGHNYIFHTLFTYLPTYMKEILQFDITQNGIYSSAPFMALWLSAITLSITGNYIVHSMRCMNPLMFTRIFGLVSNVGAALLMVSAVHVGCSRAWTIAFYIMAMAIKSLYYMTININTNELSKNYGGILFGVCNFVGCLCGIGGNAFIGAVTTNRKISEWQLVFWVNLGIAVGTSIIFFILSSSDRQAFDYDEEEESPPSGR